MHLSYVIAVVASVGATVSAISGLQPFKPSSVVTTDAAQSESVMTTPTDPGSSTRSLRVQEQEGNTENDDAATDLDDSEQRINGNEENGDAAADLDDSEERFYGTFLNTVGVNLKNHLGFGATGPSSAQAALQKQPELLAKANTLTMKTGAQAEPLSMQHAANVAPAMKKAGLERIKTDKYLNELFQGSKAAKGLKGQTREAILQERLLARYRNLFDEKDMTADKFRATLTRGSPMTDEADGAVDIIYSRLVIDRLRKTLRQYSVEPAVSTQSKETWKLIEGNPIALTHFGRLMDDTTKLDDVIRELGKVKGGEEAAKLILKAVSIVDVYNLKKLEHLKLVDNIAAKRKVTVSDWVDKKTKQFDLGTWNLQKMKAEANINAKTERDDIKYDMLNGLIKARLSTGTMKKGTSFDPQTEVTNVISLLEKNEFAQRFLPEVVGGKNKEQLDKLLHVRNPNPDAAKRAEIEETSKLIGRIRELSKNMKF
uniref:RxLR effector candidate protein n=1 Tax=Peronospora matthiolae TaxID=2874970 RepID=A0AAV1V291_9STRA